jgi:hypothetical protein
MFLITTKLYMNKRDVIELTHRHPHTGRLSPASHITMRNPNAVKHILKNIYKVKADIQYSNGSSLRFPRAESEYSLQRKQKTMRVAIGTIAAQNWDTVSLIKEWGVDIPLWIAADDGTPMVEFEWHETMLCIQVAVALHQEKFEDLLFDQWEEKYGTDVLMTYPWQIFIYKKQYPLELKWFKTEDWRKSKDNKEEQNNTEENQEGEDQGKGGGKSKGKGKGKDKQKRGKGKGGGKNKGKGKGKGK